MAIFSRLLNRAQASVDSAIDNAVNRVLIAIPFLIAAGFATAALAHRLTREFGMETGNLMIAGMFAVVGAILAGILRTRSPASADDTASEPEALRSDAAESETGAAFGDADRELMMAALTSAAPIAIPALLRFVVRNLPLVLAIFGALFVMTRQSTDQPASDQTQPA